MDTHTCLPRPEPPLTFLATKVIQKIGLCICLYDLLWASEGVISQGTGSANVNGMCNPFLYDLTSTPG